MIFSRLLTCVCVFLSFLECFVPVTAFPQSFLNATNLRRSKRQLNRRVTFVQTIPRQQPNDRTLSNYIPNYLQTDESGPWGPWTESSQCSRTCGGGVAHQDRICMDLRADGRHSCIGQTRRYFSCNVQDCPPNSKNFRALQCERFNSVPDKEQKYYSWEPYHHPNSPCELFCAPKGGKFYQRMETKVIDGTKCRNDGSLDICVDGQCMPVGCDNILGSSKIEDQCRVCGGDGSTCSVIKGIFDGDNFEVGYNDILLIPVGATSIVIQKTQPTRNFLAVRNTEGKYYLNGNWKIEFPREIRFAGTVFQYERKQPGSAAPETLRARGPTTEAVFIVLLYQEKNLGVTYEYAVPIVPRTPSPDSYLWTTGEFEECSQTCGGGVQARPVRCVQESNRDIVDERLCDLLTKPEVNVTCNNQPCPSRWKIGEWSECTQECGGGTQFRIVYCHQMKDGNTVLVPDEACEESKPIFMRACNLDKECPEWVVSEWSECDKECGTGNQNRSVECHEKETGEILDDSSCNAKEKPADKQSCSLGPCEGVEWIVSDWSGCDGSCSPRMESREVHCSNEEGTVFPNDACEPKKMPELTRPCPKSEICDPMWYASEWTDCSVKCGNGVQSRVVFCGTWENNSVIKIEDKMCDPEKRFEDMQNCSADSCQGIWFTGPWDRRMNRTTHDELIKLFSPNRVVFCGTWEDDSVIKIEDKMCDPEKKFEDMQNCSADSCQDIWFTGPWDRCSVPCGGGETTRKILCFHENEVVDASQCNPNEKPFDTETCNMKPCDVEDPFILDGLMAVGGCKNSEYGCCSDGMTPAAGLNYEGCHKLNISGTNVSCETAEFGCCSDGFTLALGPFKKGCQSTIKCNNTTFGCCPDEITTATGPEFEGCPEEIPCINSTYGCCDDNETAASGPAFEGCPETEDCFNSTYGCCDDGFTSATGPNGEGCEKSPSGLDIIPDEIESSGEDCYSLPFGCCPDGLTPARGSDQEGCEEVENGTDCKRSAFGCCDDRITPAEGPMKKGCPEFEGSGDGGSGEVPCEDSMFGCCPDNITIAKGFEGEGCYCNDSTFGCCPDNVTFAVGPNMEGCFENCTDSFFGCCNDNVTFAVGPNMEGCFENCTDSFFGCCDDNVTFALGPNGEGCFPEDCSNSTFGCCPDNVTTAVGPDYEGCEFEDCANTTYGCCPDNITIAVGPDYEGCELEDCVNTTYGCCPDNVTVALGPDNEGCTPEECANTTYGCCPDNVTIAQGPNGEGCIIDCSNTSFGCCPDNVTVALGPDNEGCNETLDCMETVFGCCPDNVSVALGPDFEGCENITSCNETEFGCCPDNVTVSLGANFEGCDETINATDVSEETTEPPPECLNTLYGCCPDEVTTALGPNLEGCCFGMRFGCCPDNKTAALGPNTLGCGCQTYPFGCCPDTITPAQGPSYQGCKCEHFHYGCCQDRITPAKGPNFAGCECQFMTYGCCPDGITPVINDRGEGCGCDSTPYGCCPDGRTAAISADLRGCPCETLPYGCCPDGHTPARTSDLRDCPCDAHFYGCCLDGITPARGQNYEGCPCESTRFGCCQDGRTVAQGPGFSGCPCETTPYGCCADNYTPAKGPLYEGCPHVLKPRPPVSTEVCNLPKEPGPCRNFTVKWFFDLSYGGCSRFWYGGCDGNGNVFATQEECEKVCVKPEGPESCLLPMVPGSCDGKIPSWYFDAGSKTCEAFTYGGCLGNNNRFISKTDCELKCIRKQPQKPIDKCSLPKDEGGCDSAIIKWYYSGERCEQFYYRGCKGNANRFESRRECEKSCMPSVIKETDICRLPHEIGPCNDFRERWYFDYESGQCHRFIFGGCNGNENNFGSFQECEKRCGRDTASEVPTDLEFKTEYCFQVQDSGPCASTEQHWYYDSTDGVCKEFYYGGCKGNRNRFKTRKECEKSCFKAQDLCTLPAVKGPCSGAFTQWYYDNSQDDCYEFSFGGCQGNANRFNNKESCYQRCKKVPVTTEAPAVTSDICSQPKEPGPCLGYYRAWYYDNSDNTCRSFIYGGCDGNENRFEKRRDCEQRCVKKAPKEPRPLVPEQPTKPANEDVCRLPVEPGPCKEEHPRWFYDAPTQSCLPFIYGGCEGNKNRFKTPDICLRFCSGIKSKAGEEVPYVTLSTTTTTTTVSPTPCPPSNCAEIRCPFGIEETFDVSGCSSCRCSNPCEVHNCPEGSRCAIDVVRSGDGVRTEPVCRRINKPGTCPSISVSSGPNDCETRCRDDAHCRGEHKCCNNGCAFTCMPPADQSFVPATQPEPATIIPGVNVTKGEVGRPAELPCDARGWPKPTVTWWRETTMLPLSSRRYEQLPNYALLIRSVEYEDAGDYSCNAHNGIGSGATYKVTLIIDLAAVPSRGDEHDTNFRDSEPEPPPFNSWDNVPMTAAVSLITSNPVVGSPLQIDCVTEGPPETKVTWQFGNAQLIVDERRRILSNHTLFITKADITDSGEYKCTAQYLNNVATSAVYLEVKTMPTETSCMDNPLFSHCESIVRNNYCGNKSYGQYCCASCMKAGQLADMPHA